MWPPSPSSCGRRRHGAVRIAGVVVSTALVGVAFLSALPARAGGISIGASPAKIYADIPPGTSTEVEIQLTNGSDIPFVFTMTAQDMGLNDKNQQIVAPLGTFKNSAASWLAFHPDKVTVPAHGSGIFKVVISVPVGATGGNYAIIMCRTVAPMPGAEGTTVGVGAALGLKVLQTTLGRSHPSLKFVEAKIQPPTASERMKVDVTVANDGDVHVRPTSELAILDSNDALVGSGKGGAPADLLPGERSTFSIDWNGEVAPGSYKALMTILYGNGASLVIEQRFQVGGPGPSKGG